jgi:hypothetical protein
LKRSEEEILSDWAGDMGLLNLEERPTYLIQKEKMVEHNVFWMMGVFRSEREDWWYDGIVGRLQRGCRMIILRWSNNT